MLVDLSSEDYVSNIQESYLQMVYDVNKDKEEKVYGVPYATNASGVIYNVDKFKEHGIEIPKTWDEFIDVLEKLQDAGEQPLLMTYKMLGQVTAHGTVLHLTLLRRASMMTVKPARPHSLEHTRKLQKNI